MFIKLKTITTFLYLLVSISLFMFFKAEFFSGGSALFIQGGTLLVGMVLGAASVIVFNTIRVLVNSLKAFIGILYVPKMQEFTILITKNYKKRALLKKKKLILLIFAVSFVSCFGVFLFRDIIFELWIKNRVTYNQWFLIFMLVSVLIQNLWNAASMLPMSVNKMNKLVLYPLLGIVVLIIQYFTLFKTGLSGHAFSFVIVDIIMLMLVIKTNFKILKEKNYLK